MALADQYAKKWDAPGVYDNGGGVYNILHRRWGVTGDGTDETAEIQAALDAVPEYSTVLFPVPPTAYGVTGLSLTKALRLVSVGGRSEIRYVGTAASAGSVIEVDKTNYGGNNFKNVLIDGFYINGNSLALYGLKLHGFTRRCRVVNCDISGAVCPMWATDVYYASFEHVEFQETPAAAPSGMDAGTYAAAKYGVYLDVAHAARFNSCVVYRIGGNSSNSYTAAVRVGSSNAIDLSGLTLEACDVTVNTKYLTNGIVLAPGTTAKADNWYVEIVDTSAELLYVQDNSSLELGNWFLNDVKSTTMLRGSRSSPVRINSINGENVDFTATVYDAGSDTALNNLSTSAISLGCGVQSGSIFDASTTTTPYGLVSDPVIADALGASGPVGYVKNGYTVSISGNYIDVQSGTAVINGQEVGFSRNTGVSQRLAPDLSVADTWNVKISAAGTPYIERQSAVRTGSAFAPTIATFTTAGASAAPTGLSAKTFSKGKTAGELELAKSTIQVAKQFSGYVSLADSGTATATDLLTLTVSNTAGEDDYLSAIIEYVASTGGGTSRSTETGVVAVALTSDSGLNRTTAVTKVGSAQALDTDMASWTLTFSGSLSANVLTVQATSETSANVATELHFTARVVGGARSAATCALASGVTPAS